VQVLLRRMRLLAQVDTHCMLITSVTVLFPLNGQATMQLPNKGWFRYLPFRQAVQLVGVIEQFAQSTVGSQSTQLNPDT
jgi:hypothetical protein